jgi:7-cyano-7-deazaguanine reductase
MSPLPEDNFDDESNLPMSATGIDPLEAVQSMTWEKWNQVVDLWNAGKSIIEIADQVDVPEFELRQSLRELHVESGSTSVLGRQVEIPTSPVDFRIDTVPNVNSDRLYIARFTCPEFTSLCPKTGQPDFATILIDYIPNKFLIESKSLKLYLFSFRNHGAFHEDCVNAIGKALSEASQPRWMRVVGIFNPRGGIPIDVFWHFGKVPDAFNKEDFPPLAYPLFRGR